MAVLEKILVDKMNRQVIEENAIFLKLTKKKQHHINRFVSSVIKYSHLIVLKETAEDGELFPSEDEIAPYEALYKQLEIGLTRKDKLIASLKTQRILYKVMTMTITQGELNEDEKFLVSESMLEIALDIFGYREKVSGELAAYDFPVDAKVQKTADKWLPYQEEYDVLVAGGMKSSTALNRMGNKIEAAIKEKPEKMFFKRRPNRTTLYRQLVLNRK